MDRGVIVMKWYSNLPWDPVQNQNTEHCVIAAPFILATYNSDFFVFTKQKIHLRVRFDDVKNIQKYKGTAHAISKRSFRDALTNENLNGISVKNAKGSTLMKINISLIIHFCLGFSLKTFWTTLNITKKELISK